MDIFDELNQAGTTIVMITHEQEIADRARKIAYIRDGILSDRPAVEPPRPKKEPITLTEEQLLHNLLYGGEGTVDDHA